MNDETPSRSAGRSGGRAARRAARAAPLAANMRPIRPGMDGGRYNPLTDIDVKNIHEAALTALDTICLLVFCAVAYWPVARRVFWIRARIRLLLIPRA